MRDLGDLAGGLAGADFGHSYGESGGRAPGGHSRSRALDRNQSGRRLFGEQRQLLLDRLELGYRLPKLDAVVGIAGRQYERGFHGARHLCGAKQCPIALHQTDVDGRGQRRRAAPGSTVPR